MGLSPIGYRVWRGKRTTRLKRIMAITEEVFRQKTKSNGIILILFIGFLTVHIAAILSAVLLPHDRLETQVMLDYMSNSVFLFFILLLSSLVTSDLISQDIGNNSFVLYFSRPMMTEDYIGGKFFGAATIMGIFCTIPPIMVAILSILTQYGSEYLGSFVVLLRTVLAGVFAALLFIPYGIMISSFTKRRAYAGVGTFMSLFVLMIVSEIFLMFSPRWILISPLYLVSFSLSMIYGEVLPDFVSGGQIIFALMLLFFVPLIFAYVRIKVLGAGG